MYVNTEVGNDSSKLVGLDIRNNRPLPCCLKIVFTSAIKSRSANFVAFHSVDGCTRIGEPFSMYMYLYLD